MTALTPKQFAEFCQATFQLRENSYDGDRYQLSLDEAAEQSCPKEWARIISILLFSGYADVWDWCDEQTERPV